VHVTLGYAQFAEPYRPCSAHRCRSRPLPKFANRAHKRHARALERPAVFTPRRRRWRRCTPAPTGVGSPGDVCGRRSREISTWSSPAPDDAARARNTFVDGQPWSTTRSCRRTSPIAKTRPRESCCRERFHLNCARIKSDEWTKARHGRCAHRGWRHGAPQRKAPHTRSWQSLWIAGCEYAWAGHDRHALACAAHFQTKRAWRAYTSLTWRRERERAWRRRILCRPTHTAGQVHVPIGRALTRCGWTRGIFF